MSCQTYYSSSQTSCPFCKSPAKRCCKCGHETYKCSSQTKNCETCGKSYCSSHSSKPCCSSCNKFLCSNSSCYKACSTCNQLLCSSHSTTCAECKLSLCTTHTPPEFKTCITCNRSFCSPACRTMHLCTTCEQVICLSDSKTCSTCGKYACVDHSVTCNSCKLDGHSTSRYFCSSHGANCAVCNTSLCTNHGAKKCAISSCNQSFCICHETTKTCSQCQNHYCSIHAPANIKTCLSCNKLFCPSHSSACTSCNEPYCTSHLPKHITKTDKVIYCINQAGYARYESPANLMPTDEGVGMFVWPDGQRTMCWFYDKKLILSREVNASECRLVEERQKFEKFKKNEENKWKEHEQEREKHAKEKEAIKEKALNDMETENAKLKQKNLELEKEKEEAQKFIASNKGPIKLNVGGVQFQTTLGNISKYPSKLSTMFNGMFAVEKDDSGAVFIDRDGTHFRHILNFLRDNALPPNLSSDVLGALKVEAVFYQLPELTNAINKYKCN